MQGILSQRPAGSYWTGRSITVDPLEYELRVVHSLRMYEQFSDPWQRSGINDGVL